MTPRSGTHQELPKLIRVLWITNVANPYRIPVWRAVAERISLKMALLARAERNRAWGFSVEQIDLPTVFVGAPVVRNGELSVYWPNRVLRKLLMEDLDAVILGGWESPAYLYSMWIAKRRGLRTISHYGSTSQSHAHASGLLALFRAWYFRRLDAHVTYGTEATKSLISMGVEEDRIITGFNSVNHKYFYDAVKYSRAKNDEQVPKGHHFLYVGQLLKRKNVESVIRAFSSMRADCDSLRIVGSGPEQQHLHDLIVDLGIMNEVVLTGPKAGDSLIEEYARANTLVLVSTNEVWGLVVNEALACGLQVVVSENCGVATDVKDMRGVYISGCSSQQVAEAMQESRKNFSGTVKDIKILTYTPEFSAECFFSAIQNPVND